MEKIIFNQIEVYGTVEPGIEKEQFILEFDVRGANNFHIYNSLLLNNTFDIVVPSLGQAFKATRISHTSSYKDVLNENTNVHFSLIYKEYNEEEDDTWTVMGGVSVTALSNWARTRALSELLVEKGIITTEEYEEKIQMVHKRDSDAMQRFIVKGEGNGKGEE